MLKFLSLINSLITLKSYHMQTTNRALISSAYQSLKGHWSVPMAAFLLYTVILVPIILVSQFFPLVGAPASFIALAPLALGFTILSLNISRNREASVGQLFDGFNVMFTAIVANLLTGVLLIVGFILLIFPVYIVMANLALVFFIIADEPQISAIDAMKKSRQMMYGYKWKFIGLTFLLSLFFILVILSLGIALLWVAPLIQVSFSKFYDDVKANPKSKSI